MKEKYYPWGGEFTECTEDGCVAVVNLNIDFTPTKKVAIYGSLRTENIGIEKIVANTISNPNIRYLVLCGEEIKGHRSGASLIALNKYGIDKQNKIKNAPGAIPYIENINEKAIKRFQKQIKTIDLIGEKNKKKINQKIQELIDKKPKPLEKPYIAIKIKPVKKLNISDKRALHSKIKINYLGKIKKRGE